jgi:predicted glycoside hydrolase/deacetylase ChbG (UPF0249 family)
LKSAADAGSVEAGLHFDLTEYPIAPGIARPVGAWMRASLLRRVNATAVRDEFRRQLDSFESTMGRAPSHVDGHQHVHQFPVIRDVVVEELLRRYRGAALPWLRSTRGAARWRLKGRVIEAMGAGALERLAHAFGFAQNASLLGVYDFAGGSQRFRGLLAQWLAAARDGDLLMCHVASAIVPGDEIAQARVDEYGVLGGEGFGQLLRDSGITPAPLRPAA